MTNSKEHDFCQDSEIGQKKLDKLSWACYNSYVRWKWSWSSSKDLKEKGLEYPMGDVRYCVYCDKKLTRLEVDALKPEEIKYHFILCKKHLLEHRAEIQRIIDHPEVDERYRTRRYK